MLDNGRLRLPKIGDVPVRWPRPLPAPASSVTVIEGAAGRYFASFVVQTTDEPLTPNDAEVGIDLGLTHFAVLSDGTGVTAPRYLRRAARKLKRSQQGLCRKKRGSAHRKKAVIKVARASKGGRHAADWQHEFPTRNMCDVRPNRWSETAVCPLVRLPLWRRPRPGRQRGSQHPRPGALGEAERLWSGPGRWAQLVRPVAAGTGRDAAAASGPGSAGVSALPAASAA
ncbi:transposase [Micromonospora purpureochromogenes]|uniref:Probable transposase IS891/IS1136/IS1341 domain-containing protein n=1 Tax=Micromonospora purpureochromogenes TaxID=47872 RepID=A0ABX2RWE4_9ACTN|nr:transposase [Micromonospora purpureochromogenes]NYF59589.1 hypothetical protein [Micromonospora purpureochromogenes]